MTTSQLHPPQHHFSSNIKSSKPSLLNKLSDQKHSLLLQSQDTASILGTKRAIQHLDLTRDMPSSELMMFMQTFIDKNQLLTLALKSVDFSVNL